MKLMVKDMVRRAPPPEALSKSSDEPYADDKGEDDGGHGPAFMSAVRDFIGATGGDASKADEAAGYLKEAIKACLEE